MEFHFDPFVGTLLLFELGIFIFFAVCADYHNATTSDTDAVSRYYPMYQDVNVMIFVGFGFLMTFLRKHAFNSIGMTFLIGAVSVQMGIMINEIVHDTFKEHKVEFDLDIPTLIRGDFAAGAVLISYGAVLGRVTPTQVLWMLLFELIFYAINEYIGVEKCEAVDMGGSMFVHTFGAYFGLSFSYFWGQPTKEERADEASVYHSDLFAMIGTVFLWMYWPSFNGALAGDNFYQQERVVINTVLALTAACIAAFAFSHLFEGKLDMVHIQNASLAGGVAIGSSSDLVVGPYASILIGFLAGVISVCGYVKLSPWLHRICGLHDTCGVHNLHGIPGIIGGVAGAISAATAGSDEYGENITEVFAARAHRSASEQGGYQGLALVISLGMSILGGAVAAFIIKNMPESISSRKKTPFSDEDEWEVPRLEFGLGYFRDRHETLELVKLVQKNREEKGRSSSGREV